MLQRFKVTVGEKIFDVAVETSTTPAQAAGCTKAAPSPSAKAPSADTSAPAGAVASSAPVTDATAVNCPLAGKIATIAVVVGAPVKAGERILTIQAPNMNTHVFAPHAGTLAVLAVRSGQSVERGQLLAQVKG